MNRAILYLLLITLILSCSDDDKAAIDCSTVFCIGGDTIRLSFFKNGQNILETEPNTAIEIIQNNENANFIINSGSKDITFYLIESVPVIIRIDNQTLNLEISSTFVEAPCCSGIRVDQLKLDGSIICEDRECNDLLNIDLN